jgi:hypothetical protein
MIKVFVCISLAFQFAAMAQSVKIGNIIFQPQVQKGKPNDLQSSNKAAILNRHPKI